MVRFGTGKFVALGGLLLAIAFFSLSSPALAERVLDPVRSLTGGCTVEELDPVADPGCPYPPFPAGPSAPFADTRAVATDDHGNIYVSSFGKKLDGTEGRIDIFAPDGEFISELKIKGPTSLAIDSKGYLYVAAGKPGSQLSVLRLTPCTPYEPAAGEIEYMADATEYCNPPVKVPVGELAEFSLNIGIAINQNDDHLFVNVGGGPGGVVEYASAEEGNGEVSKTPTATQPRAVGMAVDAARDRIYASVGLDDERVDIFDLSTVEGTPPGEYKKVGSIDDSDLPPLAGGKPGDLGYLLSIAVDEGTGHVFVLDGGNCNLYEFDESGAYVTEIDFGFQCNKAGSEIGVDNGPSSPNGGESTKGHYLYVPSHEKGTGHSFAFFESTVDSPEVKSLEAKNITEDEAELQARVNPRNLPTTYRFELQVVGASTWTVVDGGTIAAGNADVEVTARAAGLAPGTSYRFRVVADNLNEEGDGGTGEAEAGFVTYPRFPLDPNCPNALLRTGPSALLPDCRAYELVTPGDPNGHPPIGTYAIGENFTNRQVSPAGEKLPFTIEGGSLPGLGGTGSLFGDPYLATRTPAGWSSTYTGPSPTQATSVWSGTSSPDQGYMFWIAEGSGSAVMGGATHSVRYPDGHSEPVGQGSIGFDRLASGKLISEGGSHIIFESANTAPVQLEPEAAPDGTTAVYDRTPDGTLHVVSLKPGDVPFEADEDATYMGASFDGEGVAFEAENTLYLRYDNTETYEIGEGVEFAGVAEGGRRVFYVEGGNLMARDLDDGVIGFSESGDVTPVQVSTDGSAAYFVSPTVLTLGEANPEGNQAQLGAQNLYLSREGQLSFVATVTDRDVEGAQVPEVDTEVTDGLGLWVEYSPSGRLGNVPARTTTDGGVLLFKSRAALTGYDTEDYAQIYRYDSAGKLHCLSCNPTGVAPGSDATLQSKNRGKNVRLFGSHAWLENLRADGRRAFFETSEPLVALDADDLQDIYQWEDEGVGSCTSPGGCVQLISSPKSLRNEYLWAISRSGDDVFFLSSELLTWQDADETPSIYDARVGGGFAEPVEPTCEGEGCRPQLAPPPPLPAALTPVLGKGDNVGKRPRCGKGKRKVKRAGKVRCVKKKKQRGSNGKRRAAAEKKGGRR